MDCIEDKEHDFREITIRCHDWSDDDWKDLTEEVWKLANQYNEIQVEEKRTIVWKD